MAEPQAKILSIHRFVTNSYNIKLPSFFPLFFFPFLPHIGNIFTFANLKNDIFCCKTLKLSVWSEKGKLPCRIVLPHFNSIIYIYFKIPQCMCKHSFFKNYVMHVVCKLKYFYLKIMGHFSHSKLKVSTAFFSVWTLVLCFLILQIFTPFFLIATVYSTVWKNHYFLG